VLTAMRHKALLVLGCVLLALALAACGGTPDSTPAPTPDTEATVQAKLNEERVAEATVEARAQAMAKTMVEATAQAVPVATLIPPSPTPTATPKPAPTATPIPAPTSKPKPAPTSTSTPPVTNVPENSLDKETVIKHFDNNEFELAIENISRQLKLNPIGSIDNDSYWIRGLSYMGLYKFRDALDDFNVLLTLPTMSTDPDVVRQEQMGIFQAIAYLSFELGLFQDAFNNLDNALDIDEKANTIFESARLSETQKTIQWLIDGINYLEAGLYEKAIERFTEFIDCSWSGKPLRDDTGAPIMPEGCTEHNYNIFIDGQGGSEHPIGYFHRGVAYKELGDLQKATSDFAKVIELDPDNSRGFSRKARNYSK
jgi:tetratricopeptide (TPR) repeat protein